MASTSTQSGHHHHHRHHHHHHGVHYQVESSDAQGAVTAATPSTAAAASTLSTAGGHQNQQQQQQHHHHHHHHKALLSPPSSPSTSNLINHTHHHHLSHRPYSPAFGMNKSGERAGAAQPQQPPQSQLPEHVISRTTGRPAPIVASSAFPIIMSGANGRSSAAGISSQQYNHSRPPPALNGHHGPLSSLGSQSHQHLHHNTSSSATSNHLHHFPGGAAGASTSSTLTAGPGPGPGSTASTAGAIGGPITAAEALNNVASASASNTLSAHPLANTAGMSPWSSANATSTLGQPSATATSTAVPRGGAGAMVHMTNGQGAGPPVHNNTSAIADANGAGGVGGASAESHNSAIRGVIEYGAALNAESARESNFSLERRRNLPITLQKLDTETEACYSEIGTIAWNLGDGAKALRAFENALSRNPYCLASLQGIARYHYEKANGTSPSAVNGINTNGINGVGGGAHSSGGMPSVEENYSKVVDYAARSLAIDDSGNEGEMWSIIGHALLQLGQMPRAYSCYQQAIAKAVRKDDPKLWYGIGILYDRYGSVEHAEEAFASVLKLDPNFHKCEEVFFRLGIIYKLQNKPDASLECFHYILARPPEPLKAVDVWYQIGHAHELKKDLALAKDAYERVLSTTPDHSKVLQHLGGIYLRENTPFHNSQKCVDYLSQSLEHDSTDPFSWYLLGRAFMQQNNYGKAYEAYQQAVYRDGKNPAYWCSIGVLYFNINQFHDALDAYTRAVRIHPFIPEIWHNLGILYESCHDQLADATDAYQRASQLEPENAPLYRRLCEVREALIHGTEVPTPPPVPQDIQPDSKSWQAVHMDVSGAKPVYLDSKSISQQASPAPEPGVASSAMPGRPLPRAGSPAAAGHSGIPPAAYNSSAAHEQIASRRSSYPRPGSSHATQSGNNAGPATGPYFEDGHRHRLAHGPGLGPGAEQGLSMASHPTHYPPQDDKNSIQRGPPGRMSASAPRNAGFPDERVSPTALHESKYRNPLSPTNSPRLRAELDYIERERQLRDAERQEREDQRNGNRPAGAQRGGVPLYSPTDQRSSSAYGNRDYPLPNGPASRRAGSPHASGMPRFAEDRPAPNRAPSSASRPLQGYSYDRYPAGPPGYPDPRRDPRYNDSRFDYPDPRDRDLAERERQVPRRSIDEEEVRRRREVDTYGPVRNGSGPRRENSPAGMMDARERDLRRPPPAATGPLSNALPSMRTAAPRGAYGPSEQGRAMAENGVPLLQKPPLPADKRKGYSQHPDIREGPLAHGARPADNLFDDETDMANALIGLAGGAPGDNASPQSAPYRAGEKRPMGGDQEDLPVKKARGPEDM